MKLEPNPTCWLHEIKEQNDPEWRKMYSESEANPWSHWHEQHKAKCEYRVTPLYAALP